MKLTIHITRFFLTVIVIGISMLVNGQVIQRYNSFKYTVNEGLLQSTMSDIDFDNNNFCWLSFPNGIQKFDGKNFIDIPVQEGLPDNKWVSFFRCKNGDLIISHSSGLSKYDIKSNKFVILYRNISTVMKPMLFIGEDESVFYCYTEQGNILGFSCGNYNKVCEIITGIPGYTNNMDLVPTISQNIVDHSIVIKAGTRIYCVNLHERKLKYGPVNIPGIYNYFMRMESVEKVMYYKFNNQNQLELERYDFSSGIAQALTGKQALSAIASRSKVYNWHDKIIISYDNHLYETNNRFDSIKYELVDFQNKPIAGKAGIVNIIEDNNGNLYLQTINDGIRKIIRNPYPIKYYGTEKKEENYTISILPDKENNRIIAGTYGSGLMIFDTLQRLIKHIKLLPGEEKGFAVNCILKKPGGDYIISVFGNKMWLLSKDLSSIKPLPVATPAGKKFANIGYFANLISSTGNSAIIKSQFNFYKIDLKTNAIREYQSSTRGDMGGILFHGKIVTHFQEHLSLFDTVSFNEVRSIPFNGTGAVRCFLKTGENTLYIGSNKGIYKVDSNYNVLMKIDKSSGLPDECIYAMDIDQKGNIWCSTNKGICRINESKSILQLTKEDGLQENEFNTGIVAKSEDGEIFFGGVNGISSFFPASINVAEEKVNLFFTGIKVNNEDKFGDTAVWNIKEIDLAYDENSLAFDFIAMANNNPARYIYQYKMEAVDEQWAQNNDLQTVHYYLPPGKYIFKIYASRVFDKDAKAMKEILIWIHPPFWKTWWFITGAALLFVLTLAYGINRYNKNKYQRKVASLESEHTLQLERERISRDLHDNIGAYASTVLYKTELLQKEALHGERNELMNDLRFASKDIITSLRETIWALKKEEYDAQDCLLRIRNFIQPFIKYYPNIHFSVNGEAPASMILHYTKALNLVRIVQEAVSNSIKHAGASEINIQSAAENEKWKLTVTDNGAGFEYEGINELQQGNGLNNMKQRALDSGFDFSIHSTNNKGTSIMIIV
ncbi:MAG: triple tyrosine motif-containing protein [Ferruginibacter sp.]